MASKKRIIGKRTDMLPVLLTQDEIREWGKKLASAEGQLTEHTQQESEAKASLKAQRSSLEGQIQVLATTIRSGHERRPVSVRVETEHGIVHEIREDTGEVLLSRALQDHERQPAMFGDEPSARILPIEDHLGPERKA